MRLSRSPCATFASTRWSPHVASGEGLGVGVPGSEVSFRNVALFAVVHLPLKALGDSTNVVFAAGTGKLRIWMPSEINVPAANGFAGMIESSFEEPPPSAAGFVQSTCWCASAVWPKSVLLGGVWL